MFVPIEKRYGSVFLSPQRIWEILDEAPLGTVWLLLTPLGLFATSDPDYRHEVLESLSKIKGQIWTEEVDPFRFSPESQIRAVLTHTGITFSAKVPDAHAWAGDPDVCRPAAHHAEEMDRFIENLLNDTHLRDATGGMRLHASVCLRSSRGTWTYEDGLFRWRAESDVPRLAPPRSSQEFRVRPPSAPDDGKAAPTF